MNFYVQCKLQRRIGVWPEGEHKGKPLFKVTTTWIPEKYAKKGKWLKLKNRETKEWENHWQIILVGFKKEESLVLDKERDYLDQRKASDV